VPRVGGRLCICRTGYMDKREEAWALSIDSKQLSVMIMMTDVCFGSLGWGRRMGRDTESALQLLRPPSTPWQKKRADDGLRLGC